MQDEKKLAHANEVFELVCRALDNRNWSYDKDEENRIVRFGVNGEDIPVHFVIFVDADRQIVRVASRLPFAMSEAKRVDGAIASCVATYALRDGCFDYKLEDGSIVFRVCASIRDSVIGEGLIQYLIDCTCVVVDEYNDKFLAIDKGVLSLEDFIKSQS